MDIADIDIDLLAQASSLEDFPDASGSNTAVRVERGVPALFTAHIGGTDYNFEWTLKSAKLSRLSQLINPYQNRDGQYNLLTGAMKEVEATLTVVDGDNRLDVDDFIFNALNTAITDAGGTPLSPEKYSDYKTALNIDWHKPMGLVFQHFAAHNRKMEEMFDAFIEMGATDITTSIPEERRRRINRIISHERGIDVAWMEVGSVSLDPERNPRQQGFQDFLTSLLTNTTRLVTSYLYIAGLKTQVDKTEEIDEKEKLRETIRREQNNLRQWVNNWGGAQRQLNALDDGTFEWNGQWGACNVPCGRFGLSAPVLETVTEEGTTFTQRKVTPQLDDDGRAMRDDNGKLIMVPESINVDFDVWKSSAEDSSDADPQTAPATVVDTTSVDEEV